MLSLTTDERVLARMFADNFEKYEDQVSDGVKSAGPRKVKAG